MHSTSSRSSLSAPEVEAPPIGPETPAMVEARSVVKRFNGNAALDGISLLVREREIFSIIGPSGCGKTTLLRAIAGLEDIDDGEIKIADEIVSSPSKKISVQPEHRNLGLVFQSYALMPHMTVFENIAMGLRARKIPDIEAKVRASLDLVGLPRMEHRYPSQLSGGEQQRVAFARSIVYQPKVMLLDEPLSNLDASERVRLRNELRILLKRTGTTAIYVTHDQEEAFVLADRVAVIDRGRMMQEGSPSEIYEHPANSFVARFVGSTNLFRASTKKMIGSQQIVIEVPELGRDLVASPTTLGETGGDKSFLVALRSTELFLRRISVSSSLDEENSIPGRVTNLDFRGSTTDYRVKVNDSSSVLVTTHPPCSPSSLAVGDDVRIYVPPEAITIIRE